MKIFVNSYQLFTSPKGLGFKNCRGRHHDGFVGVHIEQGNVQQLLELSSCKKGVSLC
jgi:hypothetical protein